MASDSLAGHTLADLIRWLESAPPETTFLYADPDDCLLARFLKAQGTPALVTGEYVDTPGDDGKYHREKYPKIFDEIAFAGGVSTYGAALARARELIRGL